MESKVPIAFGEGFAKQEGLNTEFHSSELVRRPKQIADWLQPHPAMAPKLRPRMRNRCIE